MARFAGSGGRSLGKISIGDIKSQVSSKINSFVEDASISGRISEIKETVGSKVSDAIDGIESRFKETAEKDIHQISNPDAKNIIEEAIKGPLTNQEDISSILDKELSNISTIQDLSSYIDL